MDSKTNKKVFSDYLPIYKLVLLFILTFGIYSFFWVHRTWKIIKKENFNINHQDKGIDEENSGNINILWRTLGLLIPIYGLYLLYKLFDSTVSYVDFKKIKNKYHGYGLFFTCLGFIILSSLFNFLFVLVVIPFVQAQILLNKVAKKHDKSPIRIKPFFIEWIVLILGFIWITLVIVGSFAPLEYEQGSLNNQTIEVNEESIIEPSQEINDACIAFCFEIEGATGYYTEYSSNLDIFSCYCMDDDNYILEQTSFEGLQYKY